MRKRDLLARLETLRNGAELEVEVHLPDDPKIRHMVVRDVYVYVADGVGVLVVGEAMEKGA